MEVKVVLGSLFGDEGKGVTVQWLCKQAISEGKTVAIVRYSGGPQAAHTVINNGVEHICSTYGSGALLGVPTYYIEGALIDPICAYNEYKVLKEKVAKVPRIHIETYVDCITPYDVMFSRKDEKTLNDGTCGKGVWACRNRHQSKDYFLYTYSQFLRFPYKDKQFQSVCDYYGVEREPELEKLYAEACKAWPYKLWMTKADMASEIKGYDVVIFESTQGLLLDADNGLFPNVTATHVGLDTVFEYIDYHNFGVNPEVYMVCRSYLTRHGNGYTPKYQLNWDLSKKHETNVFNEYQGNFKTGILEKRLIERVVDRHRLDCIQKKRGLVFNLVITHMDLVSENKFFELDNGYFVEKYDELYGFNSTMLAISNCFGVEFKNIYYNDSPESNIKEWKFN